VCVLGGKPWDGDWWAVLVDFGQKHGFNMGLKAGKHMLVTLGLSETWGTWWICWNCGEIG